jgi:3-isopropylmalate/(R)-2-methylmalate dehydratase small subunit
VRALMAAAPAGELTVDLEALEITDGNGSVVQFEFDPFDRERLLEGLDDIALTLRHADAIDEYEQEHAPRVQTNALAL